MSDSKSLFHSCLYFTANALARTITKMAEQEFRKTGISPSLAFFLMVVIDEPGISQKELSKRLKLAPSTVTRFADAHVHYGNIKRKKEKKIVRHFPTVKGETLYKQIRKAWLDLYNRYTEILGKKTGDKLTSDIDTADTLLEKNI